MAPLSPDEPQISVRGVAVDYGQGASRVRVLSDISFTVPRGRFVSLIGPSGCGKSTLLKLLSGLVAPSEGEVLVGGMSPAAAARARRLGPGFQDATLMPWKTAIENVAALMRVGDRRRPEAEIKARAAEMLRLVGLDHASGRYPAQLSGGMRQRVAIARALTVDPEVLMMDEPFGALDAITREEMSAFLLDIWQRTGKTVVFVTHSIDEAVFLSSEVHVMARNPARITRSITIPLAYPRNDESFAVPEFARATATLRQLLRDGHAQPRAA
jgi:NitT/TauT family transport system ATP-binding protein